MQGRRLCALTALSGIEKGETTLSSTSQEFPIMRYGRKYRGLWQSGDILSLLTHHFVRQATWTVKMGEGKMFLVVEGRERSGKSSSATKTDPRSRQTPRTTQPYRSAASRLSRLRQSLRSFYPREGGSSKWINSRELSESTTFDMNLTVCL